MVVVAAFVTAACSSGGGDAGGESFEPPSGEGGGTVEAFCAAAEELDAAFQEDLFAGDPETLDERVDQLQSVFEAAADAAPGEISDEMDILLAEARDQYEALRGIEDPTDQDEVDAVFEGLFSETSAEFDEANDTASASPLEECGIDLG